MYVAEPCCSLRYMALTTLFDESRSQISERAHDYQVKSFYCRGFKLCCQSCAGGKSARVKGASADLDIC